MWDLVCMGSLLTSICFTLYHVLVSPVSEAVFCLSHLVVSVYLFPICSSEACGY